MWSIGCIFAELLEMQEENQPDPSCRKPLFGPNPWAGCLSQTYMCFNEQFCQCDQFDQINLVFHIIGTPTSQEIEKIRDDEARNYVKKLRPRYPINFEKKYPGTSKHGMYRARRIFGCSNFQGWTGL